MKLILNETVANLGTVGDVVTVKAGYGRNYLLPMGLATLADPKKIKVIEHHQRALENKRRRELTKAEELAAAINGMELTFLRKTNTMNQIFGSVTSGDIEGVIHEKGFTNILRRQITIERPIKALGEFDVAVKLNGGITSQIKVIVEKEATDDD
jgi:large subunit ribosomal protein L9